MGFFENLDVFLLAFLVEKIEYFEGYLKIFQGDKEGLWGTEYMSTWLKNNYGIHVPYIDTRHNENIALF
ncbi:hypothetical protein HNR36_001603 [Ureibacillus thermosphaericus]|uniref:Uncharacterized protein n=1 Tax=Ureibacillus thermosphaericus TaxID=51173 RepID=A0A840PLC4_URETH|nr:hypothetical protein [Ureibacillus thermosphaericus]